jgi:hypothetical protein
MANFADLRNATMTGAFGLKVQAEQSNVDMMSTETMRAIMAATPAWQAAIRASNAAATRLSLMPVKNLVLAATAEGSDPAPSTFSPTNRDLATARNAALFEIGDDAANRIPPGLEAILPALNMSLDRNPTRQEMEALMVFGALAYHGTLNRIAKLTKDLMPSWGTLSFGGTGTNPTFTVLENARDALVKAGNRGRALWLVTMDQAAHYRDNVVSLQGAVQWHGVAQRLVDTGGTAVVQNILDGLDAARVDDLTVAVGDTVGGIFYPNGITIKIETPKLQEGAQLVGVIGDPASPLATIERRRDAGSVTKISIVSWIGVGIADDSAGSKGIFAT